MSGDIHYEILADAGKGWKLQCVENEREAAKDRAREIFDETRPLAVKVVRSGYDQRKGEYVESEVTYLGEKRPGGKAPSEAGSQGALCQSVEDFYRASSRRIIRKHLRQWLDGVKATPIELLHHAEFVNKLENSGTMLQGAIQRTAMEHAKVTGQSVHEHQKVLFDLFDKGAGRLRLLWRDEKRPLMDGDDVDGLLEKVSGAEQEIFLFNCALTLWLQKHQKPQDKLDALIDLLPRSKNTKVVALLDNYLTDFLEDPNVLRQMLGEDNNFGNAVMKSVVMLAPQAGEKVEVPKRYAGFIGMIQSGKLSICRNSLVRRLASTIASQRPFRDGHPMNEAKFSLRLRSLMRDGDSEFLGNWEMEEAFHARSERLVSTTAIGRLTEDMEAAAERINAMLELEPAVYGEANKRALGEFVIAILDQPAKQKELGQGEGPAMQRMRELADMQSRIRRTGFPISMKKKASGILDAICTSILKEERVIDRLVAKADPVSACLALLKLCSTENLTEANAIGFVRYHLVNILKTPGFLDTFLTGVDDKDAQKRVLAELQNAIAKAKVSTGTITAPGSD